MSRASQLRVRDCIGRLLELFSRRIMKRQKSSFVRDLAMLMLFACAICVMLKAQNTSFHNAPASAKGAKNPYAGENRAAEIGGQIYAVNCAKCHGAQGQGTGNIPALKEG